VGSAGAAADGELADGGGVDHSGMATCTATIWRINVLVMMVMMGSQQQQQHPGGQLGSLTAWPGECRGREEEPS
jgi:hypothetical protein